jgi:ABC-type glutathione transport system ATPase component
MRTEHGWAQILHGISLELLKNQSLGIVGPSGAGKSMTVNALCGLLPRMKSKIEGEIAFGDKRNVVAMDSVKRQRICSSNIALIPQNSIGALNPYQKLGTQLRETFALHRPGSQDDVILACLREMGLDAGASLLNKYPHQISGGMRQRIAIAMALSSNAKILIADEPTTSLDVVNQMRFIGLMEELRAKLGLSLIYISHNLSMVALLCKDVLVMRGGRVIDFGKTDDLIGIHNGLRNVTSCASTRHDEQPAGKKARDPILQVTDLRKNFVQRRGVFRGKYVTRAVDGISFSVERGETLGISGESGCGKSTLAKMIVRLIEPDGGDITFDGTGILALSRERFRKIRPSLQMISQNPFDALDPRMKIVDLLTEGMKEHGVSPDWEKQWEALKFLLHECGLDVSYLDRYPDSLSGGELQRLNIARALTLRPRLLIADEVVSSLDIPTQCQIMALLISLKKAHGLSIIFISHDLGVIREIADRALVMREGIIVDEGRVPDVFQGAKNAYTKEMLKAARFAV